MSDSLLHRPSGSLAQGPYGVVLTPEEAGWGYASLRVVELAPGRSEVLSTDEDELLVVPLSGSATVVSEGTEMALAGRPSVFSGATDVAYVPRDADVTLTGGSRGATLALAGARAATRLAPRYGPIESVPVELRGAGTCSREVRDLCGATTFPADRLIVCEVLTPAGNWSSYPPHKHDEERPGESALEEIYYFEIASGPGGPGFGYQRVYGSAHRPVELLAEVHSGDVVLVPHGWHGPSMAAPGYAMYYLNVMAGPGERAWKVCDDPAHSWIRSTWPGQEIDGRLTGGDPLAPAPERSAR